MALTRASSLKSSLLGSMLSISPSVDWEVDESGLAVRKDLTGRWVIHSITYPKKAFVEGIVYLRRYGLERQSFTSRARAVDAVRLALAEEPVSRSYATKWKKIRDGTYLSTDGHWELQRAANGCRLRPSSQQAKEAQAQDLKKAQEELCKIMERSFSIHLKGALTLRLCARYADRASEELGLISSCGE